MADPKTEQQKAAGAEGRLQEYIALLKGEGREPYAAALRLKHPQKNPLQIDAMVEVELQPKIQHAANFVFANPQLLARKPQEGIDLLALAVKARPELLFERQELAPRKVETRPKLHRDNTVRVIAMILGVPKEAGAEASEQVRAAERQLLRAATPTVAGKFPDAFFRNMNAFDHAFDLDFAPTPEDRTRAIAAYFEKHHPELAAQKKPYDRAMEIVAGDTPAAPGRKAVHASVNAYLEKLGLPPANRAEGITPDQIVQNMTNHEYLQRTYGERFKDFERDSPEYQKEWSRYKVHFTERVHQAAYVASQSHTSSFFKHAPEWRPHFPPVEELVENPRAYKGIRRVINRAAQTDIRSNTKEHEEQGSVLANPDIWKMLKPRDAQTIIRTLVNHRPGPSFEFAPAWSEPFLTSKEGRDDLRDMLDTLAVSHGSFALIMGDRWVPTYRQVADSAQEKAMWREVIPAVRQTNYSSKALAYPKYWPAAYPDPQERHAVLRALVADSMPYAPETVLMSTPLWHSAYPGGKDTRRPVEILGEALANVTSPPRMTLRYAGSLQLVHQADPQVARDMVHKAALALPPDAIDHVPGLQPLYADKPEALRALIKEIAPQAADAILRRGDKWIPMFEKTTAAVEGTLKEAQELIFAAAKKRPAMVEDTVKSWLPAFREAPERLVEFVKEYGEEAKKGADPGKPDDANSRAQEFKNKLKDAILNTIRDNSAQYPQLEEKLEVLQFLKADITVPAHPYAHLTPRAAMPLAAAEAVMPAAPQAKLPLAPRLQSVDKTTAV